MAIPKPSATLAAPNYFNLKRRTIVHHIHLTAFAATSFNPCAGQATRFAPIHETSGICVPSIYAGSSLDAAIYETIFHDVPTKASFKTIPKQSVVIRSHAELEVGRQLRLIQLRNPDLLKWHIRRKQLIGSSAKRYAQTAQWAEAIHHQFPQAEGLIWTSNQCDPDDAYLFFGDRVTATDFKLTRGRNGVTDSSFLADVRSAGQRSGITITL
jgi:hypothetical protein